MLKRGSSSFHSSSWPSYVCEETVGLVSIMESMIACVSSTAAASASNWALCSSSASSSMSAAA
eukprot:11257548-Heterocapsa_arctica.AAC.1